MKTTKPVLNENEILNESSAKLSEANINKQKEGNLTIKVFPSGISEEDLTALFLGLVRVVKKKFELDSRAQLINLNLNNENLQNQLKAKQAECNRLKNEIIYLKSKLTDLPN